jgi:hypothetical protein
MKQIGLPLFLLKTIKKLSHKKGKVNNIKNKFNNVGEG